MAVASATAGVSQAFPVGASGSRTAVNDSMGARSQVSAMLAAIAVVGILLFLTAPIAHLPKGVLEAVVFAVGLTIVDAVRRSARPGDAVLGFDAVLGRFADVSEHPDARVVTGVVVYRLDDRLFFANAGYVTRRMREAVRGAPTMAHWLVLDAEAIAHIDSTAMEALRNLVDELRGSGVSLVVARMRASLTRLLDDAGLGAHIGEQRFYPTVQAAVHACVAEEATRDTASAG